MNCPNPPDHQQFHVDDLIWGKVTGEPWWPAIVSAQIPSTESTLYRVDYFGNHHTHCLLPADKIIRYSALNQPNFNGRLSPQLKRAIHEASSMFSVLEQSKIGLSSCEDLKILPLSIENENTDLKMNEDREESQNIPQQFHPQIPLKHSEKSQTNSSSQAKTLKLTQQKNATFKRKIKKLPIKEMRVNSKNLTVNVKNELNSLLTKYKLDVIPKTCAKTDHCIDHDYLVHKKLVKILRYFGKSAEQAVKCSLSLRPRVKGAQSLRELTRELKAARMVAQNP